jgi:hypothetical protein
MRGKQYFRILAGYFENNTSFQGPSLERIIILKIPEKNRK